MEETTISEMRYKIKELASIFSNQGTEEAHIALSEAISDLEKILCQFPKISVCYTGKCKKEYSRQEYENLIKNGESKVGFYTGDDIYYRYEKYEKQGTLALSCNDRVNRFFQFALNYLPRVEEYSSIYCIKDAKPYGGRNIEKSLDILGSAYRNLFVDDFVYRTCNQNLAIILGNIMFPSYTYSNYVLASSINAHPFNSNDALICYDDGRIVRYNGIYQKEKTIGNI